MGKCAHPRQLAMWIVNFVSNFLNFPRKAEPWNEVETSCHRCYLNQEYSRVCRCMTSKFLKLFWCKKVDLWKLKKLQLYTNGFILVVWKP